MLRPRLLAAALAASLAACASPTPSWPPSSSSQVAGGPVGFADFATDDDIVVETPADQRPALLGAIHLGRDLSHVPLVGLADHGRALLVVTSDGEVCALDAATGAPIRGARQDGLAGATVSALCTRTATVAWADDDVVRAYALDGAHAPAARREVDETIAAIAIAPTGDVLAVTHEDGIELLALPSLEPLADADLPDACGEPTALAWDAAGRRLAIAGRRGVVVLDRDLAVVHEVAREDEQYAVAFSPDGLGLAFGGHACRIERLDLTTGRTRTLIEGQPYWITTLGYSPDGALLAAGDESCDVWAFDAGTGARRFHAKHHAECWLTCAAWGPRGELLFGCRPNEHDDRPGEWSANVVAEASLSAEHRAAADALARERAALIAAAREGELGPDGPALARALAAAPRDAPGGADLTGVPALDVAAGVPLVLGVPVLSSLWRPHAEVTPVGSTALALAALGAPRSPSQATLFGSSIFGGQVARFPAPEVDLDVVVQTRAAIEAVARDPRGSEALARLVALEAERHATLQRESKRVRAAGFAIHAWQVGVDPAADAPASPDAP